MLARSGLFCYSFLLFSILWSLAIHGQTNTLTSLKRDLSKTSQPESRKELVLKICDQYYSMASDSLLKYMLIGERMAIEGKDQKYLYHLGAYRINYLTKTGKPEEAVFLADSLIKNKYPGTSNAVIQRMQVEKCRALIRNNQSGLAIEVSFKLLQQAEKLKDTGMVIQAYVLLGWAHMEIEKHAEAIRWLEQARQYTVNEMYFIRHPALFNNLASSYNNAGQTEQALTYANMGIDYAKKGENLTILANALNIRADILLKRKDNNAALKDLEEALRVRSLLGDPYYILADMGQLSYFYASIGQFNKGIELAKRAIDIAEKGRQTQKLMYLYSALAENYKQSGQDARLAETLMTIIALKDTVYQKNSERAIAELEGKYNYQKNQNTIMQQKYELSKSRYILVGSITLLMLSILLFILIYKNYQHIQRRKLQGILNEQKILSEEAVLTAREKERKRIAADLHDNLGAHAAAISSNVRYLKEGIFNQKELIFNLDENASGMVNHLNDTIWVLKNERLYFTNLSDRFKLWLQRLLVNYPDIRYHFNEQIGKDIELSPNKILHLFLLLKESVNNAIKHSGCSDLTVHFMFDDKREIIVEDNGTGFDRDGVYSGNGLQNMRKRASECGWTISWESNRPKGTRVILRETTIN